MTASPKILIVEDNDDTRELLHFYFRNHGFMVSTAVDGEEGIATATIEQPDIILTDLYMPRVSGIEMVLALRAIPETAQIPIMVLTAYQNQLTDEAREAGVIQVLFKPLNFDDLVSIVLGIIKQFKINP
jgi:two-component system, chemotaxis family, chemotaxis protein CheY